MAPTSEEMLEMVRRSTQPASLPSLPELRLCLVTPTTPLWRATEADLSRLGLAAPFWAFVWAGGQGLARHVLDHPEEVAGKRVLDFAAGSGAVAIAAMKAGAAAVRVTDIDPFAIEAARLNAQLNDVALDLVLGDVIDDPCADIDVVLAGDVFFDRDLARRSMRWFRELATRGLSVLVGDPGRYHMPKNDLAWRGRYTLAEDPDIEDEGVRHCNVLAVVAPQAASAGP